MAQIFLSYASEDRPRAKAFAEALRDKGWTVFWDRTVPPGKVFDRVIDEALRQASCVVVLWSEASVDSNWVKEEITDASQRGTLVPVLIDDVPLPLGFRRLQAARLVGWPDVNDANEFDQLMASIDALVGTLVRRSLESAPPKSAGWFRAAKPRRIKAAKPVSQIVTYLAAAPPFVAAAVRQAIQTLKTLGVLFVFFALGMIAANVAFAATRDQVAPLVAAIPVWIVGLVVTFIMWRKKRRVTRTAELR